MVLHERATAMRIVLYTNARKINRVVIVHKPIITGLFLPAIYSIQSFQFACKPGYFYYKLAFKQIIEKINDKRSCKHDGEIVDRPFGPYMLTCVGNAIGEIK